MDAYSRGLNLGPLKSGFKKALGHILTGEHRCNTNQTALLCFSKKSKYVHFPKLSSSRNSRAHHLAKSLSCIFTYRCRPQLFIFLSASCSFLSRGLPLQRLMSSLAAPSLWSWTRWSSPPPLPPLCRGCSPSGPSPKGKASIPLPHPPRTSRAAKATTRSQRASCS